jgi:hypothetical protein
MKIRYIGSKKNTSTPHSVQEFLKSIKEYVVPQIPHRSGRLTSCDSLFACTMANSPPALALKAIAGNAFIKVRLRGVTRRQRSQYASNRLSFIVAPSKHAPVLVQLHTLSTGFSGGNEFRSGLDQIQRFCRKFRCRASKVRPLHLADIRILTKCGQKEMPSV